MLHKIVVLLIKPITFSDVPVAAVVAELSLRSLTQMAGGGGGGGQMQ